MKKQGKDTGQEVRRPWLNSAPALTSQRTVGKSVYLSWPQFPYLYWCQTKKLKESNVIIYAKTLGKL